MRAIYNTSPPPAESSDSRKPTPKPDSVPHEDRLASADSESSFERQLDHGTHHDSLSIANSSSEDSDIQIHHSLHASEAHVGAERLRGKCFWSHARVRRVPRRELLFLFNGYEE